MPEIIARNMSTARFWWTGAVGIERNTTAEYERRETVEVCKQNDGMCKFWQWPAVGALP